ncbi:hypothetical protein E2562_016006 [Oryza meyeriana var. granulata]|uniref:Uncharacterized protein n=1 Tax=Oryza meyeriana var. granulata TaxID=110450 RepID=A0A6G1EKN0_9ORYZ|nr:hypothetical protein E2562_016006 [Oryza meyeriana var. granulata]
MSKAAGSHRFCWGWARMPAAVDSSVHGTVGRWRQTAAVEDCDNFGSSEQRDVGDFDSRGQRYAGNLGTKNISDGLCEG